MFIIASRYWLGTGVHSALSEWLSVLDVRMNETESATEKERGGGGERDEKNTKAHIWK